VLINVGMRAPREDGSIPCLPEEKPQYEWSRTGAGVVATAAAALDADGAPEWVCRAYTACNTFRSFFKQFGLHSSE
jgi:hypothetical protein